MHILYTNNNKHNKNMHAHTHTIIMNTCMQVWSSARGVQSGPTPDENDGGGASAWVTRG